MDSYEALIVGKDDAFLGQYLAHNREEVYESLTKDTYEYRANRGHSRLTYAAINGDCIAIDILAIDFEQDVDERDVNGCTALYNAVVCNQFQAVHRLLKWGADPHLFASKKEWTPLMAAACLGRPDLVKLLLWHHRDVESASPRTGETALYCAAFGDNLECVKMVLSATTPKSLWVRARSGYCALDLAIDAAMKTNDDQVIRYLLDACASDLRHRGTNLTMCLTRVVRKYGNNGIAHLLRTHGAK